jgi:DNA-binding response OmpR family regulator
MAKILVVDDSASVGRAAKEHLEADGYMVSAVQSGETALAAVESERPDLVLLDMRLPDASGFEICEKIRERGHSFPILITGDSDADSPWIRGLAAGFLSKPYTQEALCAKVRALLPAVGGAPAASKPAWDSPLVLLHHLRNSIGSVAQILDMFSRKTDEAARAKFIELVKGAAQSSMNTIEEYVSLLQPIALKSVPIALDSWLKSEVAAHPISNQTSIKVLWKIDGVSLPETLGDVDQLRRAVDAVLSNAAESMAAGGTLSVGAYGDAARNWAHISFQDSGPGMEDYISARSLEPFFTMKKGRRGVGLSWAQKIARAHGGELEVSSVPGSGTCILLRLPVKKGR